MDHHSAKVEKLKGARGEGLQSRSCRIEEYNSERGGGGRVKRVLARRKLSESTMP